MAVFRQFTETKISGAIDIAMRTGKVHFYGINNHINIIIAVNMSILRWIQQEEMMGHSCFSLQDIQRALPSMTSQIMLNELSRLARKKIITSVHNGFYVKVPVHYAARGEVPPVFYIDQLMHHLGKPYYISLLSAGQLLGAAHQRPQKFFVFTTFPASSTSSRKNPHIVWNYRRDIFPELLLRQNSETGHVLYSGVELTAVDLVQYEQFVGGLPIAATVISELLDKVDYLKAPLCLFKTASLAAFQRLGYIIEEILGGSKQADELYCRLKKLNMNLRWVPLSRRHALSTPCPKHTRWRLLINTDIEADEI